VGGGEWESSVTIERLGDDIVEPVTVRVVDESGRSHMLRWDGRGRRGTVRARTRGPIDEIVVDPAGRLVEDPDLSDNHPRLDNLDPAPLRPPILNAASLELSVTEVQPDLIVDFSVRRQYDLRKSLGIGFHSTARGIGGNVRFFHGFGGKRTLNASEWFAGGLLSFDRLSADFADFGQPGSSIGLYALVYRDTRQFVWDPWVGSSVSFGLGPSLAILDDGEVTLSASSSIRWTHLWTPAPGRTLALIGGTGISLGELQPHEEQSIAGRALLRTYEVDEARGKLRVYGIAEYRHTLTKSLGWNFFHLAWFRGVQLAAFAAGGLVSREVDLEGLVARHSLYTEVGGGVRLHFDYFGVQPALLSIDVGVPLSRKAFDWVDDCATRDGATGQCTATRPPWALRIGFDQTL
jgi:YD repeat-containing protein